MDAAAEQVERTLGPIQLWVNNAFTGAIAFFDDVEPREFERITAVTYFGFVNGTRAALRDMTPLGPARSCRSAPHRSGRPGR